MFFELFKGGKILSYKVFTFRNYLIALWRLSRKKVGLLFENQQTFRPTKIADLHNKIC